MLLKLYHNSILGNLNSILTNGLIPGGGENGSQCWQSTFHKTGVYFVHSSGLLPQDRMYSTKQEVEDFCSGKEFIGCVEVLLYVELPIDESLDYLKIVPDEEVLEPVTAPPSKETFKFSVNPEQCESIVHLGRVDQEFIKGVYVPFTKEIFDYVNSNIKNTERIKYLNLL